MNHLTPESEQREYVERARKATRDIKEQLAAKEQIVGKMPQYPRD